MIGRGALLAVLLLMSLAAPASAVTSSDEMLADPAQEARARALGRELRCLVCQNQAIDDSNAELAKDLRRIVRERVVAGDGDQAIKDFLVARYGEFVLLRPPVLPSTWLLWFGPPAVLALGTGLVFAFYRRQGRAAGVDDDSPRQLSAEERRRLDRLLAPGAAGGGSR